LHALRVRSSQPREHFTDITQIHAWSVCVTDEESGQSVAFSHNSLSL
jgi:hypothetical protein